MALHLPAIPGQPVRRENSTCAYTAKIYKFARMMEGVEVYEVECEQTPDHNDSGAWDRFNAEQAERINAAAEPGDLLLIPFGVCQQSLAERVDLMTVEYGIGYGGVFADFRVFESYAWMHTVYGQMYGAHDADGRYYDAVIPNYFEVDDFPAGDGGDYLLYVGRRTERKGVGVASRIAQEAEMPLLIAGAGDFDPDHGEVLGNVGPDERGRLMAGARALLAPSAYLEPFGGAVVEAALCGTPAITPDWGAFTETVRHGATGYRCHTLGEYVWAAHNAEALDREAIRTNAIANYSTEAIAPRYRSYFEQLQTLSEGGWFSKWEGISV